MNIASWWLTTMILWSGQFFCLIIRTSLFSSIIWTQGTWCMALIKLLCLTICVCVYFNCHDIRVYHIFPVLFVKSSLHLCRCLLTVIRYTVVAYSHLLLDTQLFVVLGFIIDCSWFATIQVCHVFYLISWIFLNVTLHLQLQILVALLSYTFISSTEKKPGASSLWPNIPLLSQGLRLWTSDNYQYTVG